MMTPAVDARFLRDYTQALEGLPIEHRDPSAPGPTRHVEFLRVHAWTMGSIFGAQGDYREARQWFDLACRASMAGVLEFGPTRPSWPRFAESETPMISWGFLRTEVGEALRAARLCTLHPWEHPLALLLAQSLQWYAEVTADEVAKFRAADGRSKLMAYAWAECIFLVACSGLALRIDAAVARARSMLEDFETHTRRRVKGPVPPLDLTRTLLGGDAHGFAKAFLSAGHFVAPPAKPPEFIQVYDARTGIHSMKEIPPPYPPHLSFFYARDVAVYLQARETLDELGPLVVSGIPEGLDPEHYFS